MSRQFPNGRVDVDAHFIRQLQGPGYETAAQALRTFGTPHALELLASVPSPAETSLFPHLHARAQEPPPPGASLLTPGERAELAARRQHNGVRP